MTTLPDSRITSGDMMKCRVETINYHYPEPQTVTQAVEVLNNGGLVVAPTETRYGLLGRADRDEVVEKVYRVKKRSPDLPTAIFVANVEMIMHYARFNPMGQFLAKLFLPGPLTLVLPALEEWRSLAVRNSKIGIRISAAPIIQMIGEQVPFPITATSANISGVPELSVINETSNILGTDINLYLDGGPLEGDVSTVVDCTTDPPKVLRKGAIAEREILTALRSQTV
jgi:L-threonylcarbamoyladenylate synthase